MSITRREPRLAGFDVYNGGGSTQLSLAPVIADLHSHHGDRSGAFVEVVVGAVGSDEDQIIRVPLPFNRAAVLESVHGSPDVYGSGIPQWGKLLKPTLGKNWMWSRVFKRRVEGTLCPNNRGAFSEMNFGDALMFGVELAQVWRQYTVSENVIGEQGEGLGLYINSYLFRDGVVTKAPLSIGDDDVVSWGGIKYQAVIKKVTI